MTATTAETPAALAAEPVLRVRDIAHHLDCDPDTIYRLINQGSLRAVRIGRLIRIPESALAEFLATGGSA